MCKHKDMVYKVSRKRGTSVGAIMVAGGVQKMWEIQEFKSLAIMNGENKWCDPMQEAWSVLSQSSSQ